MPVTKSELWRIYTERNPHWLTENVTFTPAGLKKLVEQTFAHGQAYGEGNDPFDELLRSTIRREGYDQQAWEDYEDARLRERASAAPSGLMQRIRRAFGS